jgi:hypothetical protein
VGTSDRLHTPSVSTVVLLERKLRIVVLYRVDAAIHPLYQHLVLDKQCGPRLRYSSLRQVSFRVMDSARIKCANFRNIRPTDGLVMALLTGGEGWHNYHHTFPWDYKTGEFGKYRTNSTSAFLDFMAGIGWAYELKSVSEEMIMKRVSRTGDGTRKFDKIVDHGDHHHGDNLTWGWGDKDMKSEEYSFVDIKNPKKE